MTRNGSWWPPRSFVGRLAESDRQALLGLGRPYVKRRGECVVVQGEQSRHVVILLKGYVKVTTATADHHEALMAVRGRGDIIGELAAISGAERSATVTACGPVEGRVMPHRDFDDFLNKHAAAFRHLTAVVGDKLVWANRRRGDFVSLPARGRVASVLRDLADVFADPADTSGRVHVNIAQSELASIAGVREVTVQKALRELRATGAISTGYRGVTIEDFSRLCDLCEIDAVEIETSD